MTAPKLTPAMRRALEKVSQGCVSMTFTPYGCENEGIGLQPLHWLCEAGYVRCLNDQEPGGVTSYYGLTEAGRKALEGK